MMKMLLRCLPLVLFAGAAHGTGMQALDDAEMSDLTGQEGISVRLELLINADSNGDPLTAASPDSYIDCSAASDPCRYALEFEGRAGKWLVFKGYSGILRINDLRLDAQTSMGALSPVSNTAYFNASKFLSSSGACLLPGGVCNAAAVSAMPALRASYPDTTPGYDIGTGTSTGFTSLELGIRLDGIGAEFGVGAAGYMADANGSFLGFNVRDLNGPAAGFAVAGSALIFGF